MVVPGSVEYIRPDMLGAVTNDICIMARSGNLFYIVYTNTD